MILLRCIHTDFSLRKVPCPAGSVIQDIPADKAEFQKARGSDFNCTNADGNSQDCKFTGDIYLKTPYPGAKLDMTFQGKENK